MGLSYLLGLSGSRAKELKQQLHSSKTYLKSDFKVHVSSGSPCADHCMTFSTSASEAEYHATCSHNHDLSCDRCEVLKNTITEIELLITATQASLRYNFRPIVVSVYQALLKLR